MKAVPALLPRRRRIQEEGNLRAHQALLFQALFWRTELSLSVGWPGRHVPRRWPQDDIGAVLWALSGVAGEWHGADTLAVSCTDPGTPMPQGLSGWPAPLCWFGVMEWREIEDNMHDVRLADSRLGGH